LRRQPLLDVQCSDMHQIHELKMRFQMNGNEHSVTKGQATRQVVVHGYVK